MNLNDADHLRSLLHYDPETGVFVWLKTRGGTARAGTKAGNIQAAGYRYINFRGRLVGAHRLAWLYMTGSWPEGDVDHINRLKADNRFCNLRVATRSQNMRNMIRKRTELSPAQGVCFDRQSGKWLSSITHESKTIHLGRYDCVSAAHEAYLKAKAELHGEFSSL